MHTADLAPLALRLCCVYIQSMNNAAEQIETRHTLAGAKRGKAQHLSHAVRVAGNEDVAVLCERVDLESLADPYAGDTQAAPTCKVCKARDPR